MHFMKTIRAFLYAAEVLLGYGPIMFLWLAGIGMGLPFSIAVIASEEPMGYLILLSILLGCVGMWGVIQLIKKLLWPGIGYPIHKYRNYLISGCIAVFITGFGVPSVNNWVSLYLVAPVLVTLHLYHVCSKYS